MRLLTKFVGYALLTGAVAFGAAKLSNDHTANRIRQSIDETIVQPLKDTIAKKDGDFKESLSTKDGAITQLTGELDSTVRTLTELTSRPYQAHQHNGFDCLIEQGTGKHYSFAKDDRGNMYFAGTELADTLERLHSEHAASDFQSAYEEIELRQKLEQYK